MAQTTATMELTIEVLARQFWAVRGEPKGDADRDYYLAKKTVSQFEYYLAHKAEVDALSAARKLQRLLPSTTEAQVVVLAVLDGSTESMIAACERLYRHSPYNGVVPEPRLTSAKEADFVHACHNSFSMAQQQLSRETLDETSFPYRDAYLARFESPTQSPDEGLAEALAGAVGLKDALAVENCTRSLAWDAQIHARVSIAETVELAVSNLPLARRGDILLTPGLSRGLPRSLLQILRASGLRGGYGDAPDPLRQAERMLWLHRLVTAPR